MAVSAKICGVSTMAALDAAMAGGASHVGFVFYPPSPRHLPFDRVLGLAPRVPGHVQRVGVFVDPDDVLISEAVTAGALNALQLHKTAPDRAAAIRERFGLPLWVALPIKTRADLTGTGRWRGLATRVLYDAKTPAGALPGGMGLRFDWRLLGGFAHPAPWALSGGLTAVNVVEAVRVTGAELVDVSSGVESAPGVKDVDKIARFLQSVAAL